MNARFFPRLEIVSLGLAVLVVVAAVIRPPQILASHSLVCPRHPRIATRRKNYHD